MAFVNEVIPEADKAKLDLKVLSVPGWRGDSMDTRWTIDRERDFFMIHIGGGGPERPNVYALSISGEIVRFRAGALATPINGG